MYMVKTYIVSKFVWTTKFMTVVFLEHGLYTNPAIYLLSLKRLKILILRPNRQNDTCFSLGCCEDFMK